MTEAEWLACNDPERMFRVFGGAFGKMRLEPILRRFAVECCRRVRHLITEKVFLAAADAGEAFADDPQNEKATIQVMARASMEGWRHLRQFANSAARHQFHAARAAVATCASTDWHAGLNTMREAAQALTQADADSCNPEELQYQAALLHCLFGNPFCSIFLDSTWLSWHDGLLMSMARQMYERHDFRDMPILADALEEAGCTDQDILDHCRQQAEHVRGCWVVDALLGKSVKRIVSSADGLAARFARRGRRGWGIFGRADLARPTPHT